MATICEVLIKLLERTGAGKLSWKPTSNEQTFVAVCGGFSMLVINDPSYGLTLSILNKANVEIDRASDKGQRPQLDELYRKARAIAFDVESLLDGLMRDLDAAG